MDSDCGFRIAGCVYGIYPNHICDYAKDGRIWKLRGNHWKGCNQLLQK